MFTVQSAPNERYVVIACGNQRVAILEIETGYVQFLLDEYEITFVSSLIDYIKTL